MDTGDAMKVTLHPAAPPPSRRALIIGGAMTAATLLTAPGVVRGQNRPPFTFPPLPYEDNALAPVISSETVGFHYGKHHRGYFDNMMKMIAGTHFADQTLEDMIRTAMVNPNRTGLYNNAAQFWNHTFYWKSMRPGGGGEPTGTMADRIGQSFGSYDGFRKAFAEAATTQFGSGWAWLVAGEDKKLQVLKTSNADTPMAQGLNCLLTCDVWEHAYYLDYQNRRADYVNAWLEKLVNWDFAAENLAAM
jgi:Fe-Mn family superoxide dismutase